MVEVVVCCVQWLSRACCGTSRSRRQRFQAGFSGWHVLNSTLPHFTASLSLMHVDPVRRWMLCHCLAASSSSFVALPELPSIHVLKG